MGKKPKIVILGAGYGGIVTAQRLQKELHYNEAEVTLVNKHVYHYITTHLHMPAAGTDSVENARVTIDTLIDTKKIQFVKSTITAIRPEQKQVELEDGVLDYDYLVISVGGEPETFGIPGLSEHAFSIRSINSVRLIREHIDYQFARYKNEVDRPDCLTFVVGGAGFTGVEFAGELADRVPYLCKNFDVDPALVNIINIEAGPTIMPGFDPELVTYAKEVLLKKGITFKLGTAIKECTEDGILTSDGEFIKSQTVVWTGGVRGNSLLAEAGFETMRNRVKVDPYLRAPGHDNIFIIGDCSIVLNNEGKPYPPTAQITIQEAQACAANLLSLMRNQSLDTFKPNLKGTVASLGKGEAVGVIGKTKITGFWASIMKKVIDLRYLLIIGGIPLVLKKGKW
jgi:NADH dehydrogenase